MNSLCPGDAGKGVYAFVDQK
jgi:hypothetical protein